MRLSICLIICVTVIAASMPAAAEEPDWRGDRDEPYVDQNEPGRLKTMLLATFIGTASGIVMGGILLVFLWNPDADANFDVFLVTGGIVGAAAGLTLGLTLPANAADEGAAASLELDNDPSINWRVPRVATFVEHLPEGGSQRLWHLNIFQLSF